MREPGRYNIGRQFNRWTIIGKTTDSRSVICRCSCGIEKPVFKCHLGAGKSEGCRKCRKLDNYLTHGMAYSPTHSNWSNMKNRCLNPKSQDYGTYGAVGITVCEKWLTFEGFLEDMGERPPGCSIDRIDGTRGYSKENCRWATPTEQANNKRTNKHVEYGGVRFTKAQLARHLGISYSALDSRLALGQPIDAPVRYSKEWHEQNRNKTDAV